MSTNPHELDEPTRDSRPRSDLHGPERFLRDGRLVDLPRRASDKDLVRRYLAARVIPLGTELDEREVTRRLAEVAEDPVGVRRGLVEVGVIERTRDGSRYWRTQRTEFD